MEFTPRIKQILLIMLESEKVISVQRIADALKISKRTVQREFTFIEGLLKGYDILLESKQGSGVWLSGSEEAKKILTQTLQGFHDINTADKKERRKYLILELLKVREPQKLFYYSEKLGVSEATVSNDMEAVEGWLKECRLTLVKKQGYGVYLEGSEKSYRIAMHRFINETINDRYMGEFTNQNEVPNGSFHSVNDDENIYQLLNIDVVKKVTDCINELKNKRLSRLTDQSYAGLILHIAIAVNRILKEEIVEEEGLSADDMRDEDYKLAEEIIKRLEDEFRIEVPRVEYTYILLHIKGAKLQFVNEDGPFSANLPQEKVMPLVERMIEEFDTELSYRLKCDEDFINGILGHLEPTFVRLKNGMHIYNPLLGVIKSEYPLEFQKAMKAAKVIETEFGYPVNEDEIGYLTMHFGAALVRIEEQKSIMRKVEIGIICASGIGIARLMKIKLKNFLKNSAEIKTYGKEDITGVVRQEVDFFVTSLSLEGMNVDYIKVSPLLTGSDLDQIRVKLQAYAYMPKHAEEKDFLKQLDMIQNVTAQINDILRNFQVLQAAPAISFEELIKEIAFTAAAADQSEQQEIIIVDILKREAVMSQVIPEYGFALLHCRTDGVTRPVFFCCVPQGAGAFENEYLQNIKSAIVMLIPNDENKQVNSDIMGYLTGNFLEDSEFLDFIFQGDEKKIKMKLEQLLKQYIKQFID